MSKRNRKSAIAEARNNDQPIATSAVVSLDSIARESGRKSGPSRPTSLADRASGRVRSHATCLIPVKG